MGWLLVVVVLTSRPGEMPSYSMPTQIGPFKTQAACEAAAKQVGRLTYTRTVCVAQEPG